MTKLEFSAQISRHRQRGVALLVVVMLMLGIAMLAVVMSVNSNTQFRLAANSQYDNVAFNLAESAAAAAENWLATGTNRTNTGFTTYATTTPHLYPLGYMATNGLDPMTMVWSDTNSVTSGGDSSARYMVELIGRNKQPLGSSAAVGGRPRSACPKVDLFRVSARGAAAKDTSKIVQTTVAMRLPDESCTGSA
jgi:Tfp pilus assembly protein PilX